MRSIVRSLLCIMYVIKCQGYKSIFLKYMTQPYPWETHRWEYSVLLFKTNEQTNSMVPWVHQAQTQKDSVISTSKCRARFLDGLSLLSPESRNGKLISNMLNENFMPLAHKLSLQVELILARNLASWDTNASFLSRADALRVPGFSLEESTIAQKSKEPSGCQKMHGTLCQARSRSHHRTGEWLVSCFCLMALIFCHSPCSLTLSP